MYINVQNSRLTIQVDALPSAECQATISNLMDCIEIEIGLVICDDRVLHVLHNELIDLLGWLDLGPSRSSAQ